MNKRDYIDNKISLHILKITSPDVNNGNGIRVTVWVSGCTNNCVGCHNEHTWKYCQGCRLDEYWYDDITTHDHIIELLKSDYIDGITISGGDPLCQTRVALNQLSSLLKEIHKTYPDKTVWLYTGKVLDDILNNGKYYNVLSQCDVVVDGPFIQSLRDITLPFRGSTNQRIINMRESFNEGKVVEIDDSIFRL